MPMCADGKSDMFEPSPWNLTQFARSCMKQWGVNPRPNWVLTEYGGRNISAASNIIFRCSVKGSRQKQLLVLHQSKMN